MRRAAATLEHYAARIALHSSVVVRSGSRGRGLFARERIAGGAVLLRVPRSCWLSAAGARREAPGALVAELDAMDGEMGAGGALSASTLVTLGLATGDPEDAAYAASLPATIDVPSLWDGPRAAALEASPARAGAARYARLQRAVHGRLRLAFPLDAFLALSCVVRSRAVSSSVSGGDPFAFALLPALDLANHSFDPNCALEERRDAFSLVVAAGDVEAGGELTVSYGPLANARLLRVYGFAVEANPHDALSLTLAPGAEPDAVAARAPLAPNAVRAVGDGPAGLAAIRASLVAALREYGTPADEDADLLADGGAGLEPWERYAAYTRLGEKGALLAQLADCDLRAAKAGATGT